ncbi:MAG: toll/interleukin-1 receptor domain-containing protein [Methylococcaceae bacterium]|nr:toll/interleukin-1 receptor domain-containing protein [Methylococcaceae bacterium]
MAEEISDVFISYAHADDEPPFGLTFGWVTIFVDELKKRLRSKLGGNGARIWMDYQLAANDKVTDALLNAISQSRTIVLFMSNGYARSEWCQKELGTFLDHNSSHKHKESVFIVELYPTNRENWHPRLQELTPIQFWRKDLDEVPQLVGWYAGS